MQAHLKTEKYLNFLVPERTGSAAEKSFTFTAIREGTYSESCPVYIDFPDLQNLPKELEVPHIGPGPGIVLAKIEELGEVTAKLAEECLNGTANFFQV